MKYDTVINIKRNKKSIAFFLKGHEFRLDAIVDVELHQDKVLDKPTVIDLEARKGDKG